MAQRTDLYSILMSYANKNNSPYIEIDPFLTFLEKYAKRASEDQIEWLKWTKDVRVKFWSELSNLAEEEKCELLHDTAEGRIYIPQFYVELLKQQYLNIDENADIPFPSEESLQIEIPGSQKTYLGVESDMRPFLTNPPENTAPIISLGFPEGFGSALVLAEAIPRRLAEAGILKIRNYLRTHGNREYAYHKLSLQLAGKERYVRDMLNQILTRPLDCYTSIENGNDFSYLFWAHFAILVKGDIRKKKDRLSEDIAAVQAVYILEGIAAYYKVLAVAKREKEMALKDLELHLEKPPYLFNLDQIIKFTSTKGILLLSQYSQEDLKNWLKKQTTESKNDSLPELLIVHDRGESCFVSKNKLLHLCARLLAESRDKIKTAVLKRWVRLIKSYRKENAMEDDREFDKLLEQYTEKYSPVLSSLLKDPKLLLVYDEMEQAGQSIPIAEKIFSKDGLLPYSAILLLKRKELLDDARIVLPFWYSSPLLAAIIAFLKRLFNKKKMKKDAEKNMESENDEDEFPGGGDNLRDPVNAAREIEFAMVPLGFTLDSYLEDLAARWSRLLNKQARENLVEDVNSLVRDNLRKTLRVQKQYKITRENLYQLAVSIVSHTPPLQSLNPKEALLTYIELYLVKLLENQQFFSNS
jgi:Ca2+-binding EF-hand superfamily protein